MLLSCAAMSEKYAILATLVVYKLVLLAIGFWATRRTHDATDFYLGGRKLGPWVAAISASASSSSAWTLLGVSGAAFAWGLPALWLFPATVGGFLINWYYVAPRLATASREKGSVTLAEYIASDADFLWRRRILKLTTVIIVFSFSFYVASQFQAAGNAFASTFELPEIQAILIGAAVILVYTLLGGFWAVSVTDTLQGLVMASTAVVLPIGAFMAVGGPSVLFESLGAISATAGTPGMYTGIAFVGFVAGTLGIGLGYPGQPHVVNRFMALEDEKALVGGRRIAIAWAVVVYTGMLLAGLCARVLFAASGPGEEAFFALASSIFHPVVAGVMIAAVLSAIMSTADSQLLVASSSIAYDLKGRESHQGLSVARWTVLGVSVVAVLLAILAPEAIFERVLFAWHAIGSAFGPLVVLMLAGRVVKPWAVVATLATGFGLTVVLHWQPDTPGDFAERLIPLFVAFAVAWYGSVRCVSRNA